MRTHCFLLSAVVVMLTVCCCSNRKEIKAPERTGNLFIDHYNTAYCIMGERYEDVSEFLLREGWTLAEMDTAEQMYLYDKAGDSMVVSLVIDLGKECEVVYAGITLSDTLCGYDGHESFVEDEDMVLEFVKHIGPTCKMKSGAVCECNGYHTYDGTYNFDGENYEELVRDLREVYGFRYFETQWNDGEGKASVSFGAFNNATTHEVGVAIEENAERLSVSPFRWF